MVELNEWAASLTGWHRFGIVLSLGIAIHMTRVLWRTLRRTTR